MGTPAAPTSFDAAITAHECLDRVAGGVLGVVVVLGLLIGPGAAVV